MHRAFHAGPLADTLVFDTGENILSEGVIHKGYHAAQTHDSDPEKQRDRRDDLRRQWCVLSGPHSLGITEHVEVEHQHVDSSEKNEQQLQNKRNVVMPVKVFRFFIFFIDSNII